jgi:hypothetical protein
MRTLTEFGGKQLIQWAKKGWRLRGSPVPIQDRRAICGPKEGWRIGDKLTWKIDLDTKHVMQPPTPVSVIEYSGFELENLDEIDEVEDEWDYNDEWRDDKDAVVCLGGYKSIDYISFMNFNMSLGFSLKVYQHYEYDSHALRYVYTGGPIRKLRSFFNRDVLMQLNKLDRDAKIEDYTDGAVAWEWMVRKGDLRGLGVLPREFDFEHPEGWDYWNDQLPRLFKHFGME